VPGQLYAPLPTRGNPTGQSSHRVTGTGIVMTRRARRQPAVHSSDPDGVFMAPVVLMGVTVLPVVELRPGRQLLLCPGIAVGSLNVTTSPRLNVNFAGVGAVCQQLPPRAATSATTICIPFCEPGSILVIPGAHHYRGAG
jgi:hypothetical protein